MTIAYEILQDILDLVEVKLGKHTQLNDTSIDEMFNNNHHINDTFYDDETEEEDNDYTIEHEDL
jgi:hypothetical protein